MAVFGAYGHTGRFVVAQLLERGFVPVLSGRDAGRLRELAAVSGPGLDVRPASVDDPASLDRALAGTAAVINCAGPFATTAAPVIEAALRAGIPYVDVAAEIEANARHVRPLHGPRPRRRSGDRPGDGLLRRPRRPAGHRGDGRLDDGRRGAHRVRPEQLAPHAPGPARRARISRERRGGRRVRYTNGQLEYHDDALPTLKWPFPDPMGTRAVIGEFTMADVVTVPSHLTIPEVRTYMTVEAAGDLAAPDTPAPSAVDEHGRSARPSSSTSSSAPATAERRAVARGQDIYAVTAPLAVEAVHRILTGRTRTVGVASAGEIFDASDLLRALSPHISVAVGQ